MYLTLELIQHTYTDEKIQVNQNQWNLDNSNLKGPGKIFELGKLIYNGHKVLGTERKVRNKEDFELRKFELSTFHSIIFVKITVRTESWFIGCSNNTVSASPQILLTF
jgi:hypothetical protein